MNALEIIARFYTLLSECSSKELAEAAMIADSSHLGNALRELAAVKNSIERRQSNSSRHGPIPDVTIRRAEPKRAPNPPPRNGFEGRVERLILDDRIFPSNGDVAKFLSSLGLDATFRGKDGRKYMAQRLIAALYMMDGDTRKRTLNKIFAVLPKSETTGWFEAIRGDGQ